MQQQKRTLLFILFLRVAAGLLVVSAIVLVALQSRLGPQVLGWALGIVLAGVAMMLLAAAGIFKQHVDTPREAMTAIARLTQQVGEVHLKLHDLRLTIERNARATPAAASATVQKDSGKEFDQIRGLLSEVRELALLPDADRRQRIDQHRRRQKAETLRDVYGMVAARDWPRAERMMVGLESEYPNDDEVAKGRSYLDHSRKLFEDETLVQFVREVETLVADGAFEQALQRVNDLVAGFPGNGDAQMLRTRVEREFELHKETNAIRLFDTMRANIDNRSWREALANAERMIQFHPTHRLTERVLDQMKTLEENAEIQERQELEVCIQQLIRDQRFDAAIEMGEDVIKRYPHSPQTESLKLLLPKVRELSSAQVDDFANLGGKLDDASIA